MELVPGYKKTEIGVLPYDWEVKPLGELFAFKNGVNADKHAYGTGVRFVNVLETITHSHLKCDDVEGRVTLPAPILATYSVKRGDVLFNRTSETDSELALAATYVDSEDVVFGGFVIRGRPRSDDLDPDYCGYALRSSVLRSQIIPLGQGAVRANIGQGNLGRVLAPVPTAAEQRAIAEALGDVDALLAGLDSLIAKKRDLKQAAMQNLLTGQTRLPGFQGEWEVKRLGELGAIYGGLTGKSKADFGAGTASYVTFMNVMTNTVIDPTLFEPVNVSPSENQNRVERGDLLFNGSSETPEEVALCSLVSSDLRSVYLNSFCFGFRLRKDDEADGLFLTYYIRSAEGREIMKSLAQGSTRYNLSKKALLAAKVRLPVLSEQTAIAAVLSDMDAELNAIEARRHKTSALKQAMMQELLTGRTRLIGLEDEEVAAC